MAYRCRQCGAWGRLSLDLGREIKLADELGGEIEEKLGRATAAAEGPSPLRRVGRMYVRMMLLALLFSLIVGFVLGTVLRQRLERPVQYLGAVAPGAAELRLAADPGDVGDAGTPVLEAGEDEQQVG